MSSGKEPNLRTPEDNGAGNEAHLKWSRDYDTYQRIEQANDIFRRECACRAALDRINLGLHTSEDVALLRRELNL